MPGTLSHMESMAIYFPRVIRDEALLRIHWGNHRCLGLDQGAVSGADTSVPRCASAKSTQSERASRPLVS